MGMGFEINTNNNKSKFARFNWPVIAQSCSVVIGILCVSLVLVAISHDEEANKKLRNERLNMFENQTKECFLNNNNKSKQFTRSEIEKLLIRNSPLKKAFCLLIGFCTVITVVHIFIYLVYKKEVYRYKFTIGFNALLAMLYILSSLFLLITTLQNDFNYGELFNLLRERDCDDDGNQTMTLYIFRWCQVNTGTSDEDQLPPVPPRFKERIENGVVCQDFNSRIIQILLALFNNFFFSVVVLTVKSRRKQIKKAIELAKDLDVEPWMWVHPQGSVQFIRHYVYQQERAKFMLNEIEAEPDAPRDPPEPQQSELKPAPPKTDDDSASKEDVATELNSTMV